MGRHPGREGGSSRQRTWACYPEVMVRARSALEGWTPQQIAAGRRWGQVWKTAGPELERIRREELRRIDPFKTVALLCGPADYRLPPRAPQPVSGLVEQQRLFAKVRRP
jgi:hypothetical protein